MSIESVPRVDAQVTEMEAGMGLFNRQYEAEKNATHEAWIAAANARRDAGREHGRDSEEYAAADAASREAAHKAQVSHELFWGKEPDPFEADPQYPGWGEDQVTAELARRGDPAAEL